MPFRYWALVGSTRTWNALVLDDLVAVLRLVVEIELVAEPRASAADDRDPERVLVGESLPGRGPCLHHLDGVRGQRDHGLGGRRSSMLRKVGVGGVASQRCGTATCRPPAHRVRWPCHSSASCGGCETCRTCIRPARTAASWHSELLNCPSSPVDRLPRCKRSRFRDRPTERRPVRSRPSRAPRRSSRSAGCCSRSGTARDRGGRSEAAVVPARTSAIVVLGSYLVLQPRAVRAGPRRVRPPGPHRRTSRPRPTSSGCRVITLFTERGPSPFFLLHVFVISSVSVRWGLAGAVPRHRRPRARLPAHDLRREPGDRQRGPRRSTARTSSVRSICSRRGT